jgi:hypothetical protein
MPFWLLPRSAKSRKQLGNNFISLSRPSLPKSGDCRLTLDMPLFIRSVHGVTLTPPWNSFTRTASARFRRPGRGISPKFRSHTDGISVIYEVHVRCCHSTVSPVPPSLRTFHFGVNRKITPMTSRRLPPCPVRGLHYLKDVGLNRLQQV